MIASTSELKKTKKELEEKTVSLTRELVRKEELLMDKDELNRIYLLRNFLADMPPVEALEFLLERLKRTKTNKEFFATMAQ